MPFDFTQLQPHMILDAVERAGGRTTGEYTQLNSYENRVFDVRLEPSDTLPTDAESSVATHTRLIAKFYRPGRWSRDAIQDEHTFLADLQAEGIPAVAPIMLENGQSIMDYEGFYVSLFPRVVGRMPQEFLTGQLKQVGRTLARIHNIGAKQKAHARLSLDPSIYGRDGLARIEKFIFMEVANAYFDAAETIIDYLDENLNFDEYIRIHGDCHRGNLLHTGDEFFFVDFDDSCNGPVVQDFWMLLSGAIDSEEGERQQEEICTGYEELRDIPDDWHLFEPLRGLRIINYAGWIAQRWQDSSFQQIFPQFTTYNYWLEELRQLEKIADQL